MMNSLLTALAALSCCVATLPAAQPQSLAEYKAIYDLELKNINEITPGMQSIEQHYLKTLTDLEAGFKKAGDFPGAIMVMEERKRFESCRMLPDATPDGTPGSIAEAQKAFRKSYAEVDSARIARIEKLTRQYVDALRGHTRILLEQDKMILAAEVNAEIERAQALLKSASTEGSKERRKWDFRKDYSLTKNPTKGWVYGWKPSLTGEFVSYQDAYSDNKWSGWRWNNFVPSVALNQGDEVREGTKPNDVQLHPGSSGQYSVVRWLAPASGRTKVTGTFGAGNAGIVDVHVLHRGMVVFQALSTAKDEPFSLNLEVKRGDCIDFAVGAGRNGFGSCATPLEAVISVQ